MSTGSIYVTRVELETTDAGIEVTVTARRVGPAWTYGGARADAADLPPDVADGLRAWLAGAPTKAEA